MIRRTAWLLLAALLIAAPAWAQTVPADPRLAEAEGYVQAARGMWQTDRLADIDRLLRQALALQEAAVGPDDLMVARTRDFLGRNHYNAGHWADAERMFRDAARIAVPKTGERTLDVAYYLGSIGASLREQHRFAEAWPYVCRSLDIRSALAAPSDPLIASSLDNMGRIALGEGRLAEASSLLDQSHFLYIAAWGPDAALVRNQEALLTRLHVLVPHAPRVDAREFCLSVPVS